MNTAYTPPAIGKTAFNCPYCGVLAKQDWFKVCVRRNLPSERIVRYISEDKKEYLKWLDRNIRDAASDSERTKWSDEWSDASFCDIRTLRLCERIIEDIEINEFFVLSASQCHACQAVALWLDDSLIHPRICTAPPASPDLPEDIRVDVEEARKILNDSPRASAALLRLVIEKLCEQLTGKTQGSLNDKINRLVEETGLHERTVEALHAVRVIGNNAVHPGKMDLKDNRDIALRLFDVVDTIVHDTFTRTKQIQKISAFLPATQKNAIAERDKTPTLKP
jgi:hypothetical protein